MSSQNTKDYAQCTECNKTLPLRFYTDRELRRTFTRCLECRRKPTATHYTCASCNQSLPRSEFIAGNNRKYQHCKKCRTAEYERKKAERRLLNNPLQIKKQILDNIGCKCIRCGYDEFASALCFHHIDPTKKDGGVSVLINQYCNSPLPSNWDKIMAEVAKCIVLCANCHNAFHAHEWESPT